MSTTRNDLLLHTRREAWCAPLFLSAKRLCVNHRFPIQFMTPIPFQQRQEWSMSQKSFYSLQRLRHLRSKRLLVWRRAPSPRALTPTALPSPPSLLAMIHPRKVLNTVLCVMYNRAIASCLLSVALSFHRVIEEWNHAIAYDMVRANWKSWTRKSWSVLLEKAKPPQ